MLFRFPNSPVATENIFLDSVTFGNQSPIDFSDLAVVSGATIISNTQISTDPINNSDNEGAASADVGDNATGGVELEQLTPGDAASENAIVQNLSSNNLNHIIDTEDNGAFEITLNFDKAFNTLLLWERGQNSKIGVKIGSNDLGMFDSASFDYTGFDINTTEIGGAQKVGSQGIKLSDFGISGSVNEITLYANSNFRGPDFKVAGATVPEPATVLGLTAVAGAFVASRRRKNDRTA